MLDLPLGTGEPQRWLPLGHIQCQQASAGSLSGTRISKLAASMCRSATLEDHKNNHMSLSAPALTPPATFLGCPSPA